MVRALERSALCVKALTQRTAAQSSGCGASACDGALRRDWNAFQASNPGALGAPFLAGAKVHAQAWFRDPLACKSSSLSSALRLTVQP